MVANRWTPINGLVANRWAPINGLVVMPLFALANTAIPLMQVGHADDGEDGEGTRREVRCALTASAARRRAKSGKREEHAPLFTAAPPC